MRRNRSLPRRSLAATAWFRRLLLIGTLTYLASWDWVQAATISGRVTPAQFANGPGGANVDVFAGGTRGEVIGQSHHTTTDADGFFQIELPAGDWAIRVDHKEVARRNVLGPVVFQGLTAGQVVTDFDLELFQPTETLHGTALSDQGKPLANIRVSGEWNDGRQAYAVDTETDAEGAFSVGIFPGEWYFFAYSLPEGFQRPQAQTITVPGHESLDFISSTKAPGLQIEQEVLPPGQAGEEYRTRLTATGGSQPFRWQVAPDSSLPGQLELTEFTGELRGILTESGQLQFTVEVSQIIGSLSGQRTLTLPAERDVTPPNLTSTTPGSIFRLRDNSVVAVHFSEPMKKLAFLDPSAIRDGLKWVHGPRFREEDRDPTQLTYHWNDSGDTLYITNPAPFEIGRHVWTFNPETTVVNRPDLGGFFRDASGNLVATDTQVFLTFNEQASAVDSNGNPTMHSDVEEVILLKQQSFKLEGSSAEFNNASLAFTIGLPPSTWNTVRTATLVTPDETTLEVPYFGIDDAGTSLHLHKLAFGIEDLNEDYPDGAYNIRLDTAHDEILETSLSFPEPAFPLPVTLLGQCELNHIVAEHDFTLPLLNTATANGERASTDLIQVVISENPGHKLLSLSPSSGGVFEAFLPAAASGSSNGSQFIETLTIPANTLKPNRDYFGYIRSLKFVDDQMLTENTRAVAAFSSLTDFQLSTKNPRVQCVSGGILPYWIGATQNDDPPLVASPETLYPPLFTTLNDGTAPAIIDLDSAGTVELQPKTTGTFDATGANSENLIITLHKGNLHFNSPPAFGAGLVVETSAAEIIPSEGNYTVTHNDETGQTTVSVLNGDVRVISRRVNATETLVSAGLAVEFSTPVSSDPEKSPELSISYLAAGAIQLRWENESNNWTLQSTSSLQPTDWKSVEAEILQTNGASLVELPASEQSQFYRLQTDRIAID